MLHQLKWAAMLVLVATPPASAQSSDADIFAKAKTTYSSDFCFAFDSGMDDVEITRHTLSWRPGWFEDDQPDATVDLIEVLCLRGAYNFGYVYFLESETDGIRPLHFATPELNIDYEDDESEVLRAMETIGFSAAAVLINPDFDAETMTLSSHSRWRGLGDAFAAGQWQFENGIFSLRSYTVDPTFNGEIDPVTVYGEEREFQ